MQRDDLLELSDARANVKYNIRHYISVTENFVLIRKRLRKKTIERLLIVDRSQIDVIMFNQSNNSDINCKSVNYVQE